MVTDILSNAQLYFGLGENIRRGLEYLRQTDFETVADGRHEIDGENLFAVVRTYNTKLLPDCRLESHRKYIDIQYVADGTERMGYAHIDGLNIREDYDAQSDVMYYHGNGDLFVCRRGTFAIFAPEDAHLPEAAEAESLKVRKVVVKVKVQP